MPASTREPSRFEQARPKYDRLIHKMAWKSARVLRGLDHEEIANELLEVLWLACNAYDPNQGSTFRNFFWVSAERRIEDLKRHSKRKKRTQEIKMVFLSAEGVTEAVEEILSNPSAEDIVMAKFAAIQEIHSREVRRKAQRRKQY